MRSQSTVLSRKRYNRFWILCPEQGVCLGVTCGVRRWWTLIPCKQRGGCTNQSLYLINALFKQLPKSAISREVRTSSFYNIFKQDISHLIPWPRGFTVTWCGWCGLCFWHKPTELALFFLFCSCVYFCLYSLSTVFRSINYPDNSPLSHSILPVLFLPYWSFQLYISLWKSSSALI